MKVPPTIEVQLVHIEGPLKGEIQSFSDSTISIGRDPSNHVQFPKDLTVISRNHAEISREGNRFKLLDKSTNGTFVNGKRVNEYYLKDGDVIIFSDGGPKVSFLTNVIEGQLDTQSIGSRTIQPFEPGDVSPPGPDPQVHVQEERPVVREPQPPQPQAPVQPSPAQEVPIQSVQVPLVIQYGPTLRSFKELPVTVGKNPGCEFYLEHASIIDQHAQIFFNQNQYWIKDLTGQNLLSVNGMPVQTQTPINPDDVLAFSPQGPKFRFLGGGRLVEIEEPPAVQPAVAEDIKEKPHQKEEPLEKGLKGAKAIFEKFLRR